MSKARAMKQLTTPWGSALDPQRIKPEYPRPNLVRDSFLNLNGAWDCRICRSGEDAPRYEGTILVPFPPEAALSGVGVVVRPEDELYYRRCFTLPEGFVRGRVLLHFGAVDQECSVLLNGQRIGGHCGGYLPFSFDITDALAAGENTLEVRVRDRTEKAPYARGKQKIDNNGPLNSLFYTPCSGIWKTVWMESVPQAHITGVRMTPRFADAQIDMLIDAACPGTAQVEILFAGETVWRGEAQTGQPLRADLPGFHPWSPDTPNLYDVAITFGGDSVRSYFGMRSFGTRRAADGVMRFYLNGEPFFFNGLLDQGYWPDSLLTPTCDDALEHDILTAKRLGYNTLRKHIKVEEERFYYLCDRLGMVVWQDMPCGGGDYNMLFVTYLPNGLEFAQRCIPDRLYGLFARGDAQGRAQFYEELEGMVRLLYNYPCIALWTPFNEGWGQFDAPKATALIRSVDSTRLINEACGWFDQGGGDVNSIHNYFYPLHVHRSGKRVVALSEFGGIAWPCPGHITSEKAYGYGTAKTQTDLSFRYEKLVKKSVLPQIRRGLSAIIYTQVSDVEDEINGILTYDREVVKLPPETALDCANALKEEFERWTK